MADAASGSRAQYYYCIEDANGNISATIPAFTPIRFNTSGLNRDTAQIDSNEINPARQRPVSRQGTYSIAGQILVEMSFGSHEDLLAILMQQTAWSPDSSATDGDYLDVGETVRTLAILERHPDVDVYNLYRHCRVGGVTIQGSLNAPATMSFDIVGESVEAYSEPTGATFGSATTSGMMVTTAGFMKEDGTALAYLTEYSLQLSNNMNPLFSLFQRPAYAVENGRFTCSGTMTAYLPNGDLWGNFLDETEVTHTLRFQDQDGDWYEFTLGSVNYTQGSKPVSGPGAVLVTYTISAGYGGTPATTVRIERAA